ncbi:MAG: CapA family protein, partial [Phormidesmis sp.]
MAIASQNSSIYSTQAPAQAPVDQLLEQIAAKVQAQLEGKAQPPEVISEAISAALTSEVTASQDDEPDSGSVNDSDNGPDNEPDNESDNEPDLTPEPIAELPSDLPDEPFQPSATGINIQRMAAEGHFQAIAYWLNERLAPHAVYAQVFADEVPGRLKVLVEYDRAPQPDRLVRFVCDRLYQLNSDVIQGVYLIVRALGAAQSAWEKAVRIPTAAERSRRIAQPATLQTIPPATHQIIHESAASQRARQSVHTQFKFFRAALLCGSIITAFCFGSFVELILTGHLSVPHIQLADEPPPTAPSPWYGEDEEATVLSPLQDDSSAATVSFRPASRFQGKTVEAALETVAVNPHDDVISPSDPTVTLLFGGDLSLNDFVFDESSDVDQLFSAIDVYRQADIAMVGLAEPLANASTSLQENFHQRTRPQAVAALQAGGIDVVGLASEGTMTYGRRGLEETLDNLDRQGLYHIGAGRNQQEAHRPEILEVKGQRVAYLGYNPEALKGAEAEKAGVALANDENRQHIADDIRAIRSQVDWIVVNYRWGDARKESEADETTENSQGGSDNTSGSQPQDRTENQPQSWQRALAHEAVDAGADLVVGYYPNQIQGTEIYRDRPIAYSLGDFDFNSTSPTNHNMAALKVSLRNRRMKVEFLPTTIHDAKLQMATGERGTKILQAIRSASKSLE